MKPGPNDPDPAPFENPGRLFLHEPGWRVSRKVGSAREFCYQMAEGQDYYHRLLDGEIYLHNTEEKLCVVCAERRGLLSREPKTLREPLMSLEFDVRLDRQETIGLAGEEPEI